MNAVNKKRRLDGAFIPCYNGAKGNPAGVKPVLFDKAARFFE